MLVKYSEHQFLEKRQQRVIWSKDEKVNAIRMKRKIDYWLIFMYICICMCFMGIRE